MIEVLHALGGAETDEEVHLVDRLEEKVVDAGFGGHFDLFEVGGGAHEHHPRRLLAGTAAGFGYDFKALLRL